MRPDSDSSRDFGSRKVYPRENWAILQKQRAAHPKSTVAISPGSGIGVAISPGSRKYMYKTRGSRKWAFYPPQSRRYPYIFMYPFTRNVQLGLDSICTSVDPLGDAPFMRACTLANFQSAQSNLDVCDNLLCARSVQQVFSYA